MSTYITQNSLDISYLYTRNIYNPSLVYLLTYLFIKHLLCIYSVWNKVNTRIVIKTAHKYSCFSQWNESSDIYHCHVVVSKASMCFAILFFSPPKQYIQLQTASALPAWVPEWEWWQCVGDFLADPWQT